MVHNVTTTWQLYRHYVTHELDNLCQMYAVPQNPKRKQSNFTYQIKVKNTQQQRCVDLYLRILVHVTTKKKNNSKFT